MVSWENLALPRNMVMIKIPRSLMGNDIETVRRTGSDYWAAHVGGEKIKTDGLKQHTRTDVITH